VQRLQDIQAKAISLLGVSPTNSKKQNESYGAVECETPKKKPKMLAAQTGRKTLFKDFIVPKLKLDKVATPMKDPSLKIEPSSLIESEPIELEPELELNQEISQALESSPKLAKETVSIQKDEVTSLASSPKKTTSVTKKMSMLPISRPSKMKSLQSTPKANNPPMVFSTQARHTKAHSFSSTKRPAAEIANPKSSKSPKIQPAKNESIAAAEFIPGNLLELNKNVFIDENSR